MAKPVANRGADYKMILVRDPGWSKAQVWAYAIAAPYHMQHELSLSALTTLSEKSKQSLTATLKRDWSIECTEDLVRTLDWLGSEGHRRPYRMMVRRYSLMRRPFVAARREELREQAEEEAEARKESWRLNAVQADWNGIRGAALAGFDAARAVMLARTGVQLGWLSEAKMWDYMLEVASDVQRSYCSWTEFATDYQISRRIWIGADGHDHFDRIVERLLAERPSPWRTLPWRVPGLEVPRAPRVLDAMTPVWSLEG